MFQEILEKVCHSCMAYSFIHIPTLTSLVNDYEFVDNFLSLFQQKKNWENFGKLFFFHNVNFVNFSREFGKTSFAINRFIIGL
jgi:hypothetical protein